MLGSRPRTCRSSRSSLAPVCKASANSSTATSTDGDVFFHNDVFSLGNQNNDVAVFKPVFVDGELVAWTGQGHQADIGGAVAGGYNPNAVEVWQEALRIPAVKIVDRGKLRQDVWEPDLRQRPAGHRAARHEGRDGRLRGRRAAHAALLKEVRPGELPRAQAGALRRDAR